MNERSFNLWARRLCLLLAFVLWVLACWYGLGGELLLAALVVLLAGAALAAAYGIYKGGGS